MSTYEFPFKMFEYVNINAIDITGRITTIKLAGHDIYFTVEYWWDGIIRVVNCMSDEISKLEDSE